MKHSAKRWIGVLLGAATIASFWGCDRTDEAAPQEAPTAAVELSESDKAQLSLTTRTAWQSAAPKIEQAANNAKLLLHTVETFLDTPTDQTLAAAQAQWQQTALHYQPLKFYRHLAALQPEHFRRLKHLLFQLGAHPIQPGYLDSFGPYEFSGLVHDVSLPLNALTLREQHGLTAEEDAALGLYAMRFMLFGTDADPRPASDFKPQTLSPEDQQQGYQNIQELPRNRRRQLLLVQAQELAQSLQQLHELWLPEAENSVYNVFVSLPLRERRALLLGSAQQELAQITAALRKHEASTESANEGAALQAPVSFLMARVAYLTEMTKILQVEQAVPQKLQQAHEVLEKVADGSGKAFTPAIEALSEAQTLLTAAQQALKAPASQTDVAETATQP